jgi:hypothetical protein
MRVPVREEFDAVVFAVDFDRYRVRFIRVPGIPEPVRVSAADLKGSLSLRPPALEIRLAIWPTCEL